MTTRILVDQDGVLANYVGLLHARAQEAFPQLAHPDLAHLRHFNTHLHYPKEVQQAVDDLSLAPDFFLAIEPIPGGREALEDMRAAGLDVWICTKPKKPSKDPYCIGNKLAWVKRHLGDFWADRVIVTRDKTLVSGDILIDDHPNADRGIRTPEWEHVLFDQPYNRSKHTKRRLTWDTWQAVLLP